MNAREMTILSPAFEADEQVPADHEVIWHVYGLTFGQGKIGVSSHAAARHPETMKMGSGLPRVIAVSSGQGRL
jgi:hypothetical protein